MLGRVILDVVLVVVFFWRADVVHELEKSSPNPPGVRPAEIVTTSTLIIEIDSETRACREKLDTAILERV